jgi:hypothetical protein
MVMAFFDSRGLIYARIIPRRATNNVTYAINILGTFMEPSRKTGLFCPSSRGVVRFHLDNMPVHTAVSMKNLMATKESSC